MRVRILYLLLCSINRFSEVGGIYSHIFLQVTLKGDRTDFKDLVSLKYFEKGTLTRPQKDDSSLRFSLKHPFWPSHEKTIRASDRNIPKIVPQAKYVVIDVCFCFCFQDTSRVY